jgi:hypothetical protein
MPGSGVLVLRFLTIAPSSTRGVALRLRPAVGVEQSELGPLTLSSGDIVAGFASSSREWQL